jgi:hypothetical protein
MDQTGLLSQQPAQDHLASVLHDTASVAVANAADTQNTDTLDLAHLSVNQLDAHAQLVQNGQAESTASDQIQALQRFVPGKSNGDHGIHTQGNLVTNGDFEDPASNGNPCGQGGPGLEHEVPGWTTDDPQYTSVGSLLSNPPVDPLFVHSGNCAVTMGPTGQTRDLTQTITGLDPTATYTLDFWVSNPRNTNSSTDSYNVLFDGNVVYTETQTTIFTYKEVTVTGLQPSSDTANLVFRTRQEPDFYGTDDISLTQDS